MKQTERLDHSLPYYLESFAADPRPGLDIFACVLRQKGVYICRASYRYLISPAFERRHHHTLRAASDADAVEQLMTSLRRSTNDATPIKRFPINGGYYEVFKELRENKELLLRAITVPTLPVIYDKEAAKILKKYKAELLLLYRADFVEAVKDFGQTERELAQDQARLWVLNILIEDAADPLARVVKGFCIGDISPENRSRASFSE